MTMGLQQNRLADLVPILLSLAREAGQAILEFYGTDAGAQVKGDGSPLTWADQAAHRIIADGLGKAFPGIPVLSEEAPDDGSRRSSDWCFVVDPLDGTKEFLSRNGEFTVNIALVHQGRPVAGVIYAPALDDLYWAWKGGGSWRQATGRPVERLETAPVQSPPRLTVSRSHRSAEEDQFIADHQVTAVVPMGSSLKGCLVARGEADLYLRAGTVSEWDIAAMDLIVTEAGGTMGTWTDPAVPLGYNQSESVLVKGFRCMGRGGLG
jgi:3'(2'), 5'-bisphosphate nucleotidase